MKQDLQKEVELLNAKIKRLTIVAYNAITLGQLDEQFSEKLLCKELGCTTSELKEIMEV